MHIEDKKGEPSTLKWVDPLLMDEQVERFYSSDLNQANLEHKFKN